MTKPEKQRMAPINEIYNRIIWDERLNSSTFIAAYTERMSSDGMREKPLAQWAPDGDIPWHRIRYIRCGNIIVWDREKHIDLISTGQLPPTAWKSNTTQTHIHTEIEAPIFNPRPVYKHNIQGWIANEDVLKDTKINTLTVATFNVLFNLYETEKIQTEKRLPAIFEQLRQCKADIIAIQEATPQFVESLLSQNWIQKYYISESHTAETVKPYGNLLLSRFPFELAEHKFSGAKHVLVGTWQINGKLLHVAVVHLTSNRAENAVEKRAHQLSTLLAYLQNYEDSLIVGDFNTRGNEQRDILTKAGFVDVWQKLHPYEAGYTFDPDCNPLAALLSLSGKPGRLDRILQRGDYIPQSILLFACTPINAQEGLYPSDHFGVRAVFNTNIEAPTNPDKMNLTSVRPIYQSAIVIIPPNDVLPAIQEIRQKYDARFERWMPHINLIYGFLPESYFEQAIEIISPVLSKLEPFTVTLTEFGTFTHRKSCTAWLRPVAEPVETRHVASLQVLQSVLQNLFPQCDEQSKKSSTGFTPHLSVGQFPNPETAYSTLPQWRPYSFTVDSVALISRRGDKPFEIKHIVHLGGELQQIINQLQPELTQEQQLRRQTIIEIIKQACAECLGTTPTLHLLGSARLGVQTPQSDIDIVCEIPGYIAGETFLHNVQQHLQDLCESSQVVLDARVPVLRLKIETISIDLLYVRYENTAHSSERRIDSTSLKAIIGCWEADLIIDTVSKYVSFDLFKILLRAVKAWAKCRCIYGNAWGFLGGFSWVILTAWSCTSYNQASDNIELMLAHFFQMLNQHDWKQPISLTEAGQQYEVQLPRDWLPIITSIEPCQNTARNVTPSTSHILRAEFQRGAELTKPILNAGTINWVSLFEPVNLQAEYNTFLEITVTNSNPQELEKHCSILEGYIIGLIIKLEQLDILVRPSTKLDKIKDGASLTLALHLPQNYDIKAVEQLASDFLSQRNQVSSTLGFSLNTNQLK
ncbi:RNA 2',3'-cyclic phosphodiesterase [Calothrix sp. NIES-4071]|nr:RNA 2',3'-cyclic phosphodiesterase [Calothrix sp. NIES-4071]BAZ63280.1 RNA 2',3'-cyclic phosphodiesterase [Calothrix sp. NIES-4105]